MLTPPKKEPRKGLPRWVWSALLLLALLGAAAALLFVVPSLKEQKKLEALSVTAENPVTELYSPVSAEISQIRISPSSSSPYTLCMEGGKLLLSENGELLSISDSYSEELINMFTNLTSQKTIAPHTEDVEDALEDMGLSPAQCSGEVLWSDGTKLTVELGIEVPDTGYSYMRVSGIDGIYACDEGMKTALNRGADRLLPLVQPDISITLISSMTITNPQGSMKISVTCDSEGMYGGSLLEPFAYPVSDENLASLLAALSSFRLGSQCREITIENQGDYGFEEPLCTVELVQEEGYETSTDESGALILSPVVAKTFHLVFGCEYREYYYTCLYEGQYYLVSKYPLQALVQYGAMDLATSYPMNMGEDAKIESILVKTDAQQYSLSAEYQENEEGEMVFSACTLNGAELTHDAFENIVSLLKETHISGNLEGVQTPSGKALWSIKLTTTAGTTREIAAYPRDTFTRILAVDGVAIHYIHAETLDTIIEAFSPAS